MYALNGCEAHLNAHMATRVLFPGTHFTTDELAEVYGQIAPVLLPHIADRPVTFKRFATDITGESFWEKDAPSFTPKWIKRLPVPRKHEPGVINYISLGSPKSLQWAASIRCIEIYSFLHKYPFITSPTVIAFDLDPGVRRSFCCARPAIKLEMELFIRPKPPGSCC
jgi:bifunctional non-homologous end joining protein LigD